MMVPEELPQATRERIPKIMLGLLRGKTNAEIAKTTIPPVTDWTIKKDRRLWRNSGGYYEWLEGEFFRLHGDMRDEDRKTAYKEVCRLLGRFISRKIEAKVEGKFDVRPSKEIEEILRGFGGIVSKVARETVERAIQEDSSGE